MNALLKWLVLDGYGQYVWPSYGLTLVVVLLNIWWARNSVTSARAAARRRIGTLQGRS